VVGIIVVAVGGDRVAEGGRGVLVGPNVVVVPAVGTDVGVG
jgi:hypothetical protein